MATGAPKNRKMVSSRFLGTPVVMYSTLAETKECLVTKQGESEIAQQLLAA